jgi:hypothetical protein
MLDNNLTTAFKIYSNFKLAFADPDLQYTVPLKNFIHQNASFRIKKRVNVPFKSFIYE